MMNLTPTPSYGCPYCNAAFTSPNARFHHLEASHGEDTAERLRLTSGAEVAVLQLRQLLARIDRERGAVSK